MLATQCPGLCCTLETSFLVISQFNCLWGMFILLQKIVEPWIPERTWVLIDHVLFEWGGTSYNQVLSCKQFGDFCLGRWEVVVLHPYQKNPDSYQALWILLSVDWSCFVWMRSCKLLPDLQLQAIRWLFLNISEMFVPHPLTKNPDSCQALFAFIEWWLIMFCLNELLQVTTRSSAVSNSVTFVLTDERWSFFIPTKKNPTAVKHFEFYWVLIDHVLFGWGHASCRQIFSCKQFGDFFLDRWEMFVSHPLTKNPDSC